MNTQHARTHMLHRRRRLAARFLAIGLLAATLYAVDSLAFPDSAEARCVGNGNPVTSTFSHGGNVRVSETPLDGTCNGNNIYRGTLRDKDSDGNCVAVRFKETGTDGKWITPVGGNSCGLPSTFEWHDHNGNSRVYQTFCIWNKETLKDVACGWGTSSGKEGEFFGTNYGY
jgi:hypothetical protein